MQSGDHKMDEGLVGVRFGKKKSSNLSVVVVSVVKPRKRSALERALALIFLYFA